MNESITGYANSTARAGGYIQERFCEACDSPGITMRLKKAAKHGSDPPMMVMQMSCSDCTYTWVETYKGVPNSWGERYD